MKANFDQLIEPEAMFRRLVLAAVAVSVALLAGPLLAQEAERDGISETPEASVLPAGADRSRPIWLDAEGKALPFSDVDEILDYLAEAEVLRSWPIGTGITEPRKLLLERDGVRAHAIFHDVDIQTPREKLRGKVVYFFRDHYANNVAAFELSRLLGTTDVPPAVVRRVDRREGSVQLWIENATTEAGRHQAGVAPPAERRLAISDMHVFDNLTYNIDRNQGNILWDAYWNLWYIDHTRAFNRDHQLPRPELVERCSRRLWKALRELDEAAVQRVLEPYLGRHEIAAILRRHQKLLRLIEERIAEQGEEAVLFSYQDAPPPDGASAEDVEIPVPPPPGHLRPAQPNG